MSRRTVTNMGLVVAALSLTGLAVHGQQIAKSSPDNAVLAPTDNVAGTLKFNVGDVDTSTLPNLLADSATTFSADEHYVLQLDSPITPQRRRALARIGVQLGQYLPTHAYTVQLGNINTQRLAAVEGVQWVGKYQDAWKREPGIGARTYATVARQQIRNAGRVVVEVVLFENESAAQVTDAINALNNTTVHRTHTIAGNPIVTATLPMASLDALTQLNAVQYIEEASELTLRNNTNRWIVQTNVNNNTPIYDNGILGSGQIIGVLDGQADQQHCSLDGGKILFYNAPDGNDTHGTHVSCTAAGDAGANDNTRGVAYGANIVFDTVPSFNETAVEAALVQHHNQGARIHTNSWGDDGTTSYNSMARGFDDFIHQNEDNLVCLAVTNTGSLRNPENAKNLLAVGASQDSPNQASHCSGGAGPTADGRRKPEIYAPGCSTTSASPSACSTTNLTGTSMACPAVAGTGALVRQYYVDGYYPTGAANAPDGFVPSGALVKATLLNSAVDMTGITGYPSNTEGWGRVLADNALFFPGDARKLTVLDDIRNASGLSTGNVQEYFLNVNTSAQRLNITMVFTDAPASAATGTGFAAVNDLDLEVVSPGGTTYLGNVFSGGMSVAGGSADIRNNVEQVQLDSPQTGNWTIRVRGTAVNSGNQGFALVATGDVIGQLPALVMSIPGGPPTQLVPGVATNFNVMIEDGDEILDTNSPMLFYRYSGGSFTPVALTPLGGDLYQATLPAALCADTPELYVEAASLSATFVRLPADAPTSFFSADVGTSGSTFDDDFESNQGWSVTNGAGLTDGAWNRGTPVGGGDRGDPPTDSDGSGQCYLTDNVDGNSDVDGGSTTLTSPVMDATNGLSVISYFRWFSNDSGDGANTDRFIVEVSDDNGGSWTNLETVGPAGAGVSGGWIQVQLDLASIGGGFALNNQFRIRFTTEDIGAASIVEAGVDGVHLTFESCEDPVPLCPADITNSTGGAPDGSVDVFDLLELLANWGTNGAGADIAPANNVVDVFDLLDLLAAWGDC